MITRLAYKVYCDLEADEGVNKSCFRASANTLEKVGGFVQGRGEGWSDGQFVEGKSIPSYETLAVDVAQSFMALENIHKC